MVFNQRLGTVPGPLSPVIWRHLLIMHQRGYVGSDVDSDLGRLTPCLLSEVKNVPWPMTS